MKKIHATFLIVGVAALTITIGMVSASASETKQACEAKFVQMLDTCVPQCQADSDDGKASDTCIRSCVDQEFGEPIPDC